MVNFTPETYQFPKTERLEDGVRSSYTYERARVIPRSGRREYSPEYL